MSDWFSQGVGSVPGLLAADLDTIVFLVVVVVSLLGRLFGRKEDPEHAEEWIEKDWSDEGEAKTKEAYDWEDEMRRLLGGEEAKPTPPALPQQQNQSPPPLPDQVQPTVTNIGGAQIVTLSSKSSVETSKAASFDDLKAAQDAFEKARTEHGHAGEKLQSKASAPTVRRRNDRGTDVATVIRMLREPAGARQAIVASTILSKPKALE